MKVNNIGWPPYSQEQLEKFKLIDELVYSKEGIKNSDKTIFRREITDSMLEYERKNPSPTFDSLQKEINELRDKIKVLESKNVNS